MPTPDDPSDHAMIVPTMPIPPREEPLHIERPGMVPLSEYEAMRDDYILLASRLDGHDAKECRMNLDRLIEQRDLFESSERARQSLSDACDHLQRELAEARRRETDQITLRKVNLKQLDEAREQRDRLAEALRGLMFNFLRYRIEPCDPCYESAETALAAVKGGTA